MYSLQALVSLFKCIACFSCEQYHNFKIEFQQKQNFSIKYSFYIKNLLNILYTICLKNKLINGYVSSNDTFKLNQTEMTEQQWIDFIPAGGIISNLKDLNVWDTKLHNGKILKPETYKLMTSYTITAQHDAFGAEKIGYGYGLRISDKTPVKYIGHGGKGLGFVSIKFYMPEKGVDVIVLENHYSTDSKLHYYFESKIREIVINSSLAK